MPSSPRPVESVGILGGGQLGRMLAIAAARLGLDTHVFAPDPDPIAASVSTRATNADYLDVTALAAFAKSVDVVTYEFENIPTEALDVLEQFCPVLPGRTALAVSQDRVAEKDYLDRLGLGTAPYEKVDDVTGLRDALSRLGVPSLLKTRRLGYDGKGQVRITDISDANAAWDAIGGSPAILERVILFDREISVIAARSTNGQVVCYDPGENVHRNGILRTTTVPAHITDAIAQDAIAIGGRILQALDYVGVMGVELFVADAELLVNEIAPRVHNSGHWTQDGCVIDQFEQHIRAICGWPLGDGNRHSDVVMTNLVGDDIHDLARFVSDPFAALHLYGKSETRPGRKMGHVNRVTPRARQ